MKLANGKVKHFDWSPYYKQLYKKNFQKWRNKKTRKHQVGNYIDIKVLEDEFKYHTQIIEK